MSDDAWGTSESPGDEAIPLSALRRIDLACDRFQNAWCSGEAPRLEEFLPSDLSPRERPVLFSDLLEIELHQRRSAGQATSKSDYHQRFPDFRDQIDRAFAALENTMDVEATARHQDHPSGASRRMGPYKLLQKIGSGGMGTVWMAEQEQPVRRRVALKLIKSGQDDKQILARFESERQALAMMDHPHVARILDAGEADDGTPYFAMELVQGLPITDYCDLHKLSPMERLELLIPVCEAVQHAHQKGIIHRDLKPSNILVCIHDGQPTAKVIDFGLAKALQHQTKLTDKTVFTEFGQVVGTVQYMSPEQARLGTVDVDTRTDIYSLGVVLYELLAGSTPIDRETLKGNALLKVLEIIRDHEPPRPSQRLHSSTDRLDAISQQRRITPAKLQQVLHGDLDWIVMKALEKDRARRYATAHDFAADLRHYLAGDAIQARPPTAGYRLRKFVRKHRVLVATSAAICVSLAAGIVGMTIYAFQAEAARAAEALARKRSEDVLKIVTDSFQSVDPASGSSADMSAKDVLLNAHQRMRQSELDAEGRMVLLDALGTCCLALGEYDSAVLIFEQLLELHRGQFGEQHLETVITQTNLAVAYDKSGRSADSVRLFEQSLALLRGKLGDKHPDTITAMGNLASACKEVGRWEEAVRLLERALELCQTGFGHGNPVTMDTMVSLAAAYLAAGRLEEGVVLHQQALELRTDSLGEGHPDTLESMHNLASAYRLSGRLEEALSLGKRALDLRRTKLGGDHPSTWHSMNNLAMIYLDAGQQQEALALFQETLELRRTHLVADHPKTLESINNLAAAYKEAGRLDLALPLHEQALALKRERFGEAHPSTLDSMNNLAAVYQSADRREEAVTLLERARQVNGDLRGDEHPTTLSIMNNLALAYVAARRMELALPLLETTLEIRKRQLGNQHPNTLKSMQNLAFAYYSADRLDDAARLFEEALELQRLQLGGEHPDTLISMSNLANVYSAAGRLEAALPLLQQTLELQRAQLGDKHPHTLLSMSNLGVAFNKAGRYEDAARLFSDCLQICQEQSPDAWHTATTRSQYGESLMHLGRLDEAASMLLEGWEGLKNSSKTIPPINRTMFLRKALDRLVQLADLQGDFEAKARWQRELQSLTVDDRVPLALPVPTPE